MLTAEKQQTISELAMSPAYKRISSVTYSYVYAANDALGVNYFTHTVYNRDGRLFASGEVDEGVFQFVDLECPARTVYTLAEFKALDTDQNWYVM